MTTATALAAFCDMLRTQTGAEVALADPQDEAPGLRVWPWRLEEVASLTNTPLRDAPRVRDTGAAAAPAVHHIHCLVLARPALTPEGLALLDQAREAMHAHPLLDDDGTPVPIVSSPLSTDQLSALFVAAASPLTVCWSIVLRPQR